MTTEFPSIIVGNDLCEVDEIEQTFSTQGTRNQVRYMTYAIFSQPWCTGIHRFKLQCVSCANVAISIGVVSNPNAQTIEWLFDSPGCGHSYQMYLGKELCNGLYHFYEGTMITTRDVNIQLNLLKPGDTIELTVDFNTNIIQFFINSLAAGPPMQIEQNIELYPAIAYVCSNSYYAEYGPLKYKLLRFTSGHSGDGEPHMMTETETKRVNAKYVPIEDSGKKEYELVIGYVRHIELELDLYSTIPSELIQKIYSFQQTYLIKGNDLCTFDADKYLLTTPGVPGVGNTFMVISKPLYHGVYTLTIECVCGANNGVAMGVITDLNQTVDEQDWLFDHCECIRMLLANASSSWWLNSNGIYERTAENTQNKLSGIEMPEEGDAFDAPDVCKMIVDLSELNISFWINSKQVGDNCTLQR
eukprot:277952_1